LSVPVYQAGDIGIQSEQSFGLKESEYAVPKVSIEIKRNVTKSEFDEVRERLRSGLGANLLDLLGQAHIERIAQGVVRIWLADSAYAHSQASPIFLCALGEAMDSLGFLVLNGAAIEARDGSASLLLSQSGCGKSTLAGSYDQSEGNLLADDFIVLDTHKQRFELLGAFRYCKLWPDAWAKMNFEVGEGTTIVPYRAKRCFELSSLEPSRYEIANIVFLEATSRPIKGYDSISVERAFRRLAFSCSKWSAARVRKDPASCFAELSHLLGSAKLHCLTWSRRESSIDETLGHLDSML
jgi:hypothetical protein